MVEAVDIVSVLATIALIFMLLGPAPDMRQILATKSTGVTPIMPLVTLFTNSWIWTIYGYLDKNIFPVAVCNFTGVVLSAIYTAIFYRYTTERAYAHKVIGSFGLFCALAAVYAFVGGFGHTGQSRSSVKNVFGYMGVVTVLVFFASSFENIAQVFKYKSAVFIPIVLVAAGAVNTALWVIYSLLDTDWFIFVPNAGSFLIACVQISLYFVFHPSKHPFDPATLEQPKDLEAPISGLPSPITTNAVPLQPVESPAYTQVKTPPAARV